MNRTFTAVATTTVLLVAGCGGSGGGESTLKETGRVATIGEAGAQSASLDMTDARTFVPNVVEARVGSVILTLENAGRIPHNLVFADSKLGKTDTVDGGATQTLTVSLAAAGTFRFTCTFHPGMDGQIVVAG